jgi:hypothetical protein
MFILNRYLNKIKVEKVSTKKVEVEVKQNLKAKVKVKVKVVIEAEKIAIIKISNKNNKLIIIKFLKMIKFLMNFKMNRFPINHISKIKMIKIKGNFFLNNLF